MANYDVYILHIKKLHLKTYSRLPLRKYKWYGQSILYPRVRDWACWIDPLSKLRAQTYKSAYEIKVVTSRSDRVIRRVDSTCTIFSLLVRHAWHSHVAPSYPGSRCQWRPIPVLQQQIPLWGRVWGFSLPMWMDIGKIYLVWDSIPVPVSSRVHVI
jgi:hypothetical protein